MAMNDPYVDENLRIVAEMQKQALENIISGNIFGSSAVPTQKFITRVLGLAPDIYDLYGESLGESWLGRYLPAEGSAVSYPLRQAMQAYEEAMAEKRGMATKPLYAAYKAPAGTPTLRTRLGEAAHQAWRLAQSGQWYNPMTKRVELMPSVVGMLAALGADVFGSAEAAPNIPRTQPGTGQGAISTPTTDFRAIINTLSPDNPYRQTLQNITRQGYAPTLKMIESALEWQARQKPEAPKPAKAEEIYNQLAGLAAQYDNAEDYRAHLRAHASEIIGKIGPDKYQALLENADLFVQGANGEPSQELPWYLRLFARRRSEAPTTTPNPDLVGEYIREAKKAKVW